MSENTLKPCPFCGGTDLTARVGDYWTLGLVSCGTCEAIALFPWDKSDTMSDLARAWNRRPGDSPEEDTE